MESFAETPDGKLLLANGVQKMLQWDGLRGQFEVAGVYPPESQVVLSGAGQGNIVGVLYAFCRYVDRDGNYSNLSPVSELYNAVSAQSPITAVSPGSPVTVQSNTAPPAIPLPTQPIVTAWIENVTGTTGVNGKVNVRTEDGEIQVFTPLPAPGDDGRPVNVPLVIPDPVTGIAEAPVTDPREWTGSGTFSLGVKTLTFSNLPVPTDPKVRRRQILRTRAGSVSVAYIVADTEDLTSTSIESELTDDELGDAQAVALFDVSGTDLSISYYTPPPSYRPFICHHQDRLFAFGSVFYTDGAVKAEQGSTTVTGIGTEWKEEMAGLYLEVDSSPGPLLVKSVDEADQTLELYEPWPGDSDAFATYAIRPDYDQDRYIDFSAAGIPGAFPPSNRKRLPADFLSGRVTGGYSLTSWLYILATNRIYRLTYGTHPSLDGEIFKAAERGCINDRSYAIVESNLFALDRRGIYVFAGGQFEAISAAIQPIFEAGSDCQFRINWAASRYFHASYDEHSEIVRFFVSLGDHLYPHDAICVDIRSRRWWTHHYGRPISCSCRGLRNGQQRNFYGSDHTEILTESTQTLDGPASDAGTLSGTLTDAGLTWLEIDTATFPSSGCVGWPVVIAGGLGKGQSRRIVEISGTRISVDQPFTTVPDTTSEIQIGGISFRWRSGWMRWAPSQEEVKRRLEVQFRPTEDQVALELKRYYDFSATAETLDSSKTFENDNGVECDAGDDALKIDTTKTNGLVRVDYSAFRESEADGVRFVSLEVAGVSNGERLRLNQITVEGAIQA